MLNVSAPHVNLLTRYLREKIIFLRSVKLLFSFTTIGFSSHQRRAEVSKGKAKQLEIAMLWLVAESRCFAENSIQGMRKRDDECVVKARIHFSARFIQ